jgi:hypothetical protein
MRQRFLMCMGLLSVLLGASVPSASQVYATSKPAAVSNQAKAWTVPRKPDGRPDLEGTWSNASNTPLERLKELGTKEFYTADEFAVLVAKQRISGGPRRPARSTL